MPSKKPRELKANLDAQASSGIHADLSSAACEPLVAPVIKPRKIVGKKKVIAPPAEPKASEVSAEILEIVKPSTDATKGPTKPVTDEKFLETVRDLVYEKLIVGEMELKIDCGFKAIELRQRITDGSQNEKLLLEILNEIRKEELGKIS